MSVESCEEIYKRYLLRALNLLHDLTSNWTVETNEEGLEIPGSGHFVVAADWIDDAERLLYDADIARKQLEAQQCDPFYWGQLSRTVVPSVERAMNELEIDKNPDYQEEGEIEALGNQAGFLQYRGRFHMPLGEGID